MPWVNLYRLLSNLRQRRVDPRDVAVFVDGHVIDLRYQRPLSEESKFEEDEDLSEDDSEED